MYALVDCNNFYVSCERLFNPKLKNKPVIVLSNNDGCAIARSEEAKALGIDMGTPAFMLQDKIDRNQVVVFSSNYTLYGDMSDRVMKTLACFCSRMEIYSIDEAFLDLHNMPYHDLLHLGMRVRTTVMRDTGIPVSIGIAPTKTLAKMANRYAKKKFRDVGIFWAANQQLVNEMLSFTSVEDICGIGHAYALLLKKNGFKTAFDFINASEDWVRLNMSVVGLRLLNELRSIAAIPWEFEPPVKKNITHSRSFGYLLTKKDEIAEALSNYAANCAMKLRQQQTHCREVTVFIQTNPHRTERPQYMRSITIELETASSNTAELIRYVLKALDLIFKEGFDYMKAGVILSDLVPEHVIQQAMFDQANRGKNKRVMEAMDAVNRSIGKETVRMAVQGFSKRYRLRADHLSQHYTTNIHHILKVS
ncbi:MAG TPA: Y-family DNA polymerase [Flavitalea sp.]|nr:Y-family DNA polymerase [Flavitalea sp.]